MIFGENIQAKLTKKQFRKLLKNSADIFKRQASGIKRQVKIVIAHDARLSSQSLYEAVITGFKIQDSRFKIIEVGLATTPMFYFMVKKLKADGGIMITASHNPKDYNGLKIVDKNAMSISGLEIRKLFKL